MSLEMQVAKINKFISEQTKQVFSGTIPQTSELEKEIGQFIDSVKKLPAAQAKEYLDLVKVWAEEMRKVSDKLNQEKALIEAEIGKAQTGNKAASAYTKASKFNQE